MSQITFLPAINIRDMENGKGRWDQTLTSLARVWADQHVTTMRICTVRQLSGTPQPDDVQEVFEQPNPLQRWAPSADDFMVIVHAFWWAVHVVRNSEWTAHSLSEKK